MGLTPSPIVPIGSAWFQRWGDGEAEVVLEYARLVEHTDTVTAEVTATSTLLGELHWSRMNVLAARARKEFATACAALLPEADWPAIVDQSCKALVRALRAGSPATPLAPHAPEPDWVADRWLVPQLIPRRQITVLYGDGGTGKSWLALAVAVAGLQGHALSRTWTVGALRRVMYLDWESAQEDHQERLWRLTAGREALPQGAILYHRLHRPLTDHVDQLQAELARHQVDLVITDSLGAAAGSEPESNDAALRTFGALRALPTTHLVLAHVSKAHADTDGPRRPFGGVYVVNTARSTIEARRVDDPDDATLRLTLHHRKTNVGRLAPASGLALTWEDDTGYVRVSQAQPDLQAASLNAQIIALLRGGSETVAGIAEALGANEGSVKSALNRLKNRSRVVPLTVAVGGRGQKTQWGLRDENRSTPGE